MEIIFFLICYPIINHQTNEKIGFINGSISLTKLNDVLANNNVYNSKMWIMTNNGLIYSNDIDQLNLNKNELEQISLEAMNNQENGIIKGTNSTIFLVKFHILTNGYSVKKLIIKFFFIIAINLCRSFP